MKRYVVHCDMEGVSGVVSPTQVDPANPLYAYGQRMLMAELLALLYGLADGGAEEVLVYDQHRAGTNIDVERLPDNARVICGRPDYSDDWPGGLEESTAGLILLGFHTKAGIDTGVMPHTYEADIRDVRLNGVSVGEIGLEAAIAGDLNVPVVMVTGDSEAIGEATSQFFEVIGVIVKDALANHCALCYPLAVTTALIRAAAAEAVKKPPEVEPFSLEGKILLEVELAPGTYRETLRRLFAPQVSQNRVVLEGRKAVTVWAEYCRMRAATRRAMRA